MVVLNSGSRAARAPWFYITVDGQHAVGQVAAFLDPGKQARISTEILVREKVGSENVVGVVGHVAADGSHIVRDLWETGRWWGRERKFGKTTTYKTIFEKFHPGVDPGLPRGTRAAVIE